MSKCLLVLLSDSVLFSPSMCLDDILLSLIVALPYFEKEVLIRFSIWTVCI